MTPSRILVGEYVTVISRVRSGICASGSVSSNRRPPRVSRLRSASADVPEGCPTVAKLIELEQERRVALRAQWPAVWRKANARKNHTWV